MIPNVPIGHIVVDKQLLSIFLTIPNKLDNMSMADLT